MIICQLLKKITHFTSGLATFFPWKLELVNSWGLTNRLLMCFSFHTGFVWLAFFHYSEYNLSFLQYSWWNWTSAILCHQTLRNYCFRHRAIPIISGFLPHLADSSQCSNCCQWQSYWVIPLRRQCWVRHLQSFIISPSKTSHN